MDDKFDPNALSEILEPGDEEQQYKNEQKVQAGFWGTLKKAAGDLPFTEDLVAAYYCSMDRETPKSVRGTLMAALAYFVLPTDLIPDFMLGFGFTDDIAVLTYVFSLIRHHMSDAHYAAAREALAKQDDLET